MATVYPTATGVWSTRTWNNAATGTAYGMAPQPGDIVLSNNLIITVDQDITVAEIANRAQAPYVTAGGYFQVTAAATNRTLNTNVSPLAGVKALTLAAATTTSDITINGNTVGGTGSGGYGVENLKTAGSLTINGTVTGGSNGYGLYNSTSGSTITIGTAIGHATTGAAGVRTVSDTQAITVSHLEFGANGIPPINGGKVFFADLVVATIKITKADFTTTTLAVASGTPIPRRVLVTGGADQ